MLSTITSFVWPHRCMACARPAEGEGLCPTCVETLIPGAGASCPRCGVVYLDPVAEWEEHTCGACLRSPPRWRRIVAAYAYGGALADAISRWKNAPDHHLGPALSTLLNHEVARAGWLPAPEHTVVVAMPPDRSRLWRRGFNPAGVLATGVARMLGVAASGDALRLRRRLGTSRGLSRSARRRRVVGAFTADPQAVSGRPVVLVDDVITTGATARGATSTLLRAGATRVDVVVLARAPL